MTETIELFCNKKQPNFHQINKKSTDIYFKVIESHLTKYLVYYLPINNFEVQLLSVV